ncbi:MAG: hypothetical protein CMM52_09730 [Rhodospirillaceae bacterium]|nr:hypothetical protein [Rhodospirillaceae bacterium]|tara:strand:- start:15135 stop:15353 length:219 start_codon:yes stop_codon:yes gene_type:complete
MASDENPVADDDGMFEGLIRASGVPVSEEEKQNLRKAYASLMGLAAKTRKPGRSWDVRMLPIFMPKPPKGQD